eukprot:COSAG06_NODE_2811_length_6246_cov_1.872295_2_plen_378_part_00
MCLCHSENDVEGCDEEALVLAVRLLTTEAYSSAVEAVSRAGGNAASSRRRLQRELETMTEIQSHMYTAVSGHPAGFQDMFRAISTYLESYRLQVVRHGMSLGADKHHLPLHTLSFIRGLCANSNDTSWQDYFRTQTHSDTSFNIVSQVELCLEEVVNTLVSGEQDNDPTKSSRMHAAHSAASMRYLEVVSELQLCLITLVQGPCYANRNALGEGGVFVTLNKLFSLNVIIEATSQQPNSAADSPKSKKRSSKSASTDDYVQLGDVEDDEDDGSDQMPAGAQTLLLDLRNNAIRLLLSLLEGRDNEFVIRQMTETVEPHWIMTELYDLSQVYYQQRLYANRDPEVERQRQKELAEHHPRDRQLLRTLYGLDRQTAETG